MKTTVITLAILLTTLLAACESTPTTPDATVKTLISSSTVDGLTIELYADSAFTVGYNPVYIKLLRGSTVIKDAHIDLTPMMDMGMMKHSAPAEDPTETVNTDNMFSGSVVYTMAGTTDEWSLDIEVHDHTTDVEVETSIPVNVASSSLVQTTKIDGVGKMIIVALDNVWNVGMNTVSFKVYSTVDGFEFEAREDLIPWLTPTMPSMGHGSSGNVDPTHKHDGLYTGKVNLTMTGDWDLEFGWAQNDTQHRVHFPILVR